MHIERIAVWGLQFRDGANNAHGLVDNVTNNVVAPFVHGVTRIPGAVTGVIEWGGHKIGVNPHNTYAGTQLVNSVMDKWSPNYERISEAETLGAYAGGHVEKATKGTAQALSRLGGSLYGAGFTKPLTNPAKPSAIAKWLGNRNKWLGYGYTGAKRGVQAASLIPTGSNVVPYVDTFVHSKNSPLYSTVLGGDRGATHDKTVRASTVQGFTNTLNAIHDNKAVLKLKKMGLKYAWKPLSQTISNELSLATGRNIGAEFNRGLNNPEVGQAWRKAGARAGGAVIEAGRQAGGWDVGAAAQAGKTTVNEATQGITPFTKDVATRYYNARPYVEGALQEAAVDYAKSKVPNPGATLRNFQWEPAPRFFRGVVEGAGTGSRTNTNSPWSKAVPDTLWNARKIPRIINKAEQVVDIVGGVGGASTSNIQRN